MSGPERDPLDDLARWLAEPAQVASISAQVTLRGTRSAHGPRTAVAIDHQLICPIEPYGAWRVTTKPTLLPRAHFSSRATSLLPTGEPRRGRTIYCHERSRAQVVAALAYHIDRRAHLPVLVTAIAFRHDIVEDPQLPAATLAGMLVLKQYAHAIAHLAGRGGHLDLDLADADREEHARRLGFRTAPRLRGFRPGGKHLRQAAPGVSSSGSAG
ncbi:MAG TPA: hypothetical protein VMB51_04050 [Solirubrobacteraceae bacterium]|nr:hypothetical protein [Solirubrobacteraceae bacterium]